MYININSPTPTRIRPTRADVDGMTVHNPTDEQLIAAGWRKVRNEIPAAPEGERVTGYTITKDYGRMCDVAAITEPDPYYAERAEYIAAAQALQDAKAAANVNQAILAMERMVKSIARVVNNEVGQ